MIAEDSGTGKSFSGLANYLEHGHRGEKKDRISWFESLNLRADNLKDASQIMKDAANENTRVDKPVYHFSINWHRDESDKVDRELALTITKEALKDLNLSDHQALIVAHKDTDHFHVHVVVNRIHPDTVKAWDGAFSKIKLEQAMARLSLEHGFEVVPGHHNSKDLGLEPPYPDVSQPSQALRFEQRTERPSFDTEAKIQLPEILQKSESWEDLKQKLQEIDIQIQARGRGLVFVNKDGLYTKASSIGREFSRANMERKFNEKFNNQPLEKETGPDISRDRLLDKSENGSVITPADSKVGDDRASISETLAHRLDLAVKDLEQFDRAEKAVTELFVQRQETLMRTQPSFELYNEMQAAKEQINKTFEELFIEPDKALNSFQSRRKRIGLDKAIDEVLAKPGKFGRSKYSASDRLVGKFVKNRHVQAIDALAGDFRKFREITGRVQAAGPSFKSDIKERFDKEAKQLLKEGQQMLLGKGQGSEKLSTRSDLERVVLTLANKTKSKELKTLPYTSSLRGQVIQSRINNLRGAEQDRKHAKNNGLSVDRNFKRFPTMPMTLKPEEKAGFIAVDTYAKARHEIEKASLWMAEGTRKAPELFENLRKAANKVVEQGTHAEKHFSRFKIDRRMLYGDTFAGKNAESKKILPFVQKKSFKIQRAITMLLRLAGVPIPRLPMPRLPRPRAPLSRGVGRELRKP